MAQVTQVGKRSLGGKILASRRECLAAIRQAAGEFGEKYVAEEFVINSINLFVYTV